MKITSRIKIKTGARTKLERMSRMFAMPDTAVVTGIPAQDAPPPHPIDKQGIAQDHEQIKGEAEADAGKEESAYLNRFFSRGPP